MSDQERQAFESACIAAQFPGTTIHIGRDKSGEYVALGMRLYRKIWEEARSYAPAPEMPERPPIFLTGRNTMDKLVVKSVVNDLCNRLQVDRATPRHEGSGVAERDTADFLKALRSGKLEVIERQAASA